MRFARVAVLSLLLAACGGTDPSEDQDTADLEYGTSVHKLPFNDQGTPAAAAGPHLSYFGGKVISKAKVLQVLYGTGTYQSFVSGNAAPNLARIPSSTESPPTSRNAMLPSNKNEERGMPSAAISSSAPDQ